MTVNPQEKNTWRVGVRSTMHAASQLTGRQDRNVDGSINVPVTYQYTVKPV